MLETCGAVGPWPVGSLQKISRGNSKKVAAFLGAWPGRMVLQIIIICWSLERSRRPASAETGGPLGWSDDRVVIWSRGDVSGKSSGSKIQMRYGRWRM